MLNVQTLYSTRLTPYTLAISLPDTTHGLVYLDSIYLMVPGYTSAHKLPYPICSESLACDSRVTQKVVQLFEIYQTTPLTRNNYILLL
jgi:hypothetical protein